MELFHKMISGLSGISEKQISSTLHLLGEGATIPFISRYRKEATGGLNEVQIEQIKEQHDKLCDIAKRKETILGTITEQGKLTVELEKRINDTWNPTELEDIYLPYKPKRKTRAEAARQKGVACHPTAITEGKQPERPCRLIRQGRGKRRGRRIERGSRYHSRASERRRTCP